MDEESSLQRNSSRVVTRKRRRICQKILNDEGWADVLCRTISLSASQSKDAMPLHASTSLDSGSGNLSHSKPSLSFKSQIEQELKEMREAIHHTHEVINSIVMKRSTVDFGVKEELQLSVSEEKKVSLSKYLSSAHACIARNVNALSIDSIDPKMEE